MNKVVLALYHKIIPKKIREKRRICSDWIVRKYNRNQPLVYEKTRQRLIQKDKIKVMFILYTESMWKLDRLYKKMLADKHFEPIITICPWSSFSEDQVHSLMKQVELFCIKKDYNYISAYDEDNKAWKDLKALINPDIVFFPQPYDNSLTYRQYQISNFLKNSLTCYATYGFSIENQQYRQYNLSFQNLMWKGFYETAIHKKLAEKYASNKGVNVVASGSPLFDEFEDVKQNLNDVWKIKDRSILRIIWAPHHTIDSDHTEYLYSCFLLYNELMLDIANRYKDQIQIAFKPHPTLKLRLHSHPDWGINKTEEYYNKWKNLDNGQLEEGGYADLFLTSDAMIFDSLSFMCEYLYTEKPFLFTMKNKYVKHSFNEFGEEVFEHIYHSYSTTDVENFIKEVVIGGEDPMKEARGRFLKEQLLPPNGVSATENIYKCISSAISQ